MVLENSILGHGDGAAGAIGAQVNIAGEVAFVHDTILLPTSRLTTDPR